MKVCRVAAVAALLCSGCTMQERKLDQLEYPGFVDVGAGYAVVSDVRSGPNNDADGFLLSLRAYPLGRWYSKPRSTAEVVLKEAADRLIDEKSKKTEIKKARDAVASAKEKIAQARIALESGPDPVSAAILARANQHNEEAKAILKGVGKEDLLASLVALTGTTARLATINDFGAAETRLQGALDQADADLGRAETSHGDLIDRLEFARGELANEEFYEVINDEDGDGEDDDLGDWRFLRRFSVFYGTSLSDFTGGGIQSTVQAVGVAFDIAPQFSIMYGVAFYEVEVDDGSGTGTLIDDTDHEQIIAVSLNLNAFKSLFGDLAN
jgi:hypothetical protein